jgi:hypothetical protein
MCKIGYDNVSKKYKLCQEATITTMNTTYTYTHRRETIIYTEIKVIT